MKPLPPILDHKRYDEPSAFEPESLLREARRQKEIRPGEVPAVCVLDPDGDIVRNLRAADRATLNPHWACYHTELWDFDYEGLRLGVLGCAVGASFAVLVAEELFCSGCELLISVTSSGQITPAKDPPFFMLIERALRDEGTSYHYCPPSDYASIGKDLLNTIERAIAELPIPVVGGATWTTDAPFRETGFAIDEARSRGILAVEMEASALYAFAAAKGRAVACFAHVTNQMGQVRGDFEKGDADGSREALELIAAVAREWLRSPIRA